jgi:hypothetical protein
LHDEDRWLLAAMDDQLRDTTQNREHLRARARELRTQADQSDIKGVATRAWRSPGATRMLRPLVWLLAERQRSRARSSPR